MKRMKRLTLLAAAALLLWMPARESRAEVTEEKTEERGRVTSVVWKDENGTPAAGPEGYAEVRYAYEYQKVTENYFDADGNPFEAPGGYCGRIVTKDSRDLLTSVEYLGADGNLTMTAMGYAMITYTHFTSGVDRLVVFCGTDRRPVTVPSLGYAQMENEYSGLTLVGRNYYDTEGNLTDGADGYACMKKKMNRNRKIVNVSYLHADGTAAAGPDGWSWCDTVWDDKGRVSENLYYDTQGSLTDAGGYARETYKYGKENIIRITRYDAQGGVVSPGGEAESVRRRVKNDRVTEEIWINADGEPVMLPEGYASISYSYTKAGELELAQYRNAAGDKTTCKQGYSAVRQTWDVNGQLLRKTYLDEAGQSVNSISGVCTEQYTYDSEGRLTGIRYFDAAGNPVSIP